MEELFIAVLSEAVDFIVEAAGALIAGAAVAYFAYKVHETITESNIAEHIRQAIQSKANEKIKKKLGGHILATIKAKKENIAEISISNFGNDAPVMDLKIESDGGIDSSVKAGMKIKMAV